MGFLNRILSSRRVCHFLLLFYINCGYFKPGFCAEHLRYTINEEEPPGTYIGNILTDSSLSDNYTSEITRILEFDFIPSRISNYFNLERSTGILKTATDIDRELVCPGQENCVLDVDVAVQPSTYFQVIKVHITILDINDFIPEFDLDDITKSLVESAPPGVIFPILPARDLDSPKFGIKSYELRGHEDKFHIDVTDLGAGGVDIRLYLNSPLDRETRDQYILELFAYDGGDPALVGTQIIRLKITDANDNVPAFFQQTHEIQVEEDYPKGLPLREVTARDIDLGKNGRLSYALEQKSERLYGDTFRVDRHNGTLLLVRDLDYERQTLYSLKILASDNGAVPLTSTAIVIIHVVDVNDNAPVIKVNDKPVDTRVTAPVEENEPKDTFVAVISVHDVDQGPNGYVDCTLRQAQDPEETFRMFELMANEYQIVTTRPLDREVEPNIEIRVACSDRGEPPLSSYVNIDVDVRDVNDNSPEFLSEPYSFTIEENNRENTFIGQVKAKDIDGGNSRVSYQFCNDADFPRDLALDERTGVLTATTHFDHEINKVINVCIQARDHGKIPNFATTYVTIIISDVNDNEPKFNQSAYEFEIYENLPAGTEVGRISAFDLDSSPFDLYIFIVDVNPYFSVDTNRGIITSNKRLDREELQSYSFAAYVRSYDYPKISDSTEITITIRDINDNTPVIHSPLPNAVLPAISNQVPVGYEVTEIMATDKDIEKNALLNYTLLEIETGFFSIDSRTGLIVTSRDFSFVTDEHRFLLRVTVRDNGFIPRESTVIFTVIVNASIPYYDQVISNPATFFRPEIKLILAASAVAFLLVIIIIVTVCVLFVRSKSSSNSKKGYWVAAKEEEYGRKANGTTYPMDSSDGSLEEKMALSVDKEAEPPAPPSVYHGSCHQCRTIPEDVEMSISGGSDESPASENSPSQSGSNYETASLRMRSNQCLLDNIPSKPYGFYNKSGTTRHVRFSEQGRNHDTHSLDRQATLIRNPEALLDGSDGTFV